jgi:hypothetical protein
MVVFAGSQRTRYAVPLKLALLAIGHAYVCAAFVQSPVQSRFSLPQSQRKASSMCGGLRTLLASESSPVVERRKILAAAIGSLVPGVGLVSMGKAAQAAAPENKKNKLTGISNEELAKLVEKDVVQNQFMVTGQLTRYIPRPVGPFAVVLPL